VAVPGLSLQAVGLGHERLGRRAGGLVDAEDVQVPDERQRVVEECAPEAEGDDSLGAAVAERLLEGDGALEVGGHAS
jgi:hypothetical protein